MDPTSGSSEPVTSDAVYCSDPKAHGVNTEWQRDHYRKAYTYLLVQLAMPPEGWYTYGAHQGSEGVGLEFWGDDGTGMPLWERPV